MPTHPINAMHTFICSFLFLMSKEKKENYLSPMNMAMLCITEIILRLPHGSASGVLDFPSRAVRHPSSI